MERNPQVGCQWRRWDLHVHTPESVVHGYPGADPWDAFLSDIASLPEGTVLGINDYLFIDGYRRVLTERDLGNLPNIAGLFPVVELRTDNLVGTDGHLNRINLHVVFSEELEPDEIWGQFINGLSPSFHLDQTAPGEATWSGVPTRESLSDFGAKIRASIPLEHRHEFNESDLELGYNNLVVSLSNVKERLLNPAFGGKALLAVGRAEWESMRWTPKSIALKKSIINGCDLVFVAAESVGAYEGARAKLREAGVNSRLVDCSDAHHLSTAIQKDRIGNFFTWICADPTFYGLLHAVTEFEQRVYVGSEPPKLASLRERPGLHIRRVQINLAPVPDEEHHFFDTDLELNPGFVAVVGKKGMGKSALLDVIGAVGASRNEPEFTFLNRQRFRNPQANRAKAYVGSLEWFDGAASSHGLDQVHDPHTPERVTYLPQQLIDKICSSDPGPAKERFAFELATVLFAHVPVAERLGAATLDDLIRLRSAAVEAKLDVLRGDLARQNREIVSIEQRLRPERRQQLQGEIELLEERLTALESAKPPDPGSPPDTETPEFAGYRSAIEELKQRLADIERDIAEATSAEGLLRAELEAVGQIETSVETLRMQFTEFTRMHRERLVYLGISLDDLARLEIHGEVLVEARRDRESRLGEISRQLDPNEEESLVKQRRKTTSEVRELEDKLDQPSRDYTARVKQHEKWVSSLEALRNGTSMEPGIAQKRAELEELDRLPSELLAARSGRRERVKEIHSALRDLVGIHQELYGPARRFIEQHPLASAANLEFGVSLVESGLSERFFDIHGRNVIGTFQGIEEGAAALLRAISSTDFDDVDSTLNFLDYLNRAVHEDLRNEDSPPVDPERAIRSGHQLEELYDLVFGLNYLAPHYLLKYSGTRVEELSPGEKGTLLLMFYLLVDPGLQPLLFDQPDENLDNETINNLLVPAIKEASQRRQVVVVTHSPNVAVVADADQMIVARFDGTSFSYVSGALESPRINRAAVDILEGTWPAFMNREEKYRAPVD